MVNVYPSGPWRNTGGRTRLLLGGAQRRSFVAHDLSEHREGFDNGTNGKGLRIGGSDRNNRGWAVS